MKERDFQSEFGKRNREIGVFELKFCKGTSIRFDAVAEHQEAALLAVSGSGLYHKITDQPFLKDMNFQRKKPFDCFNLVYIPAYVVVMFWEPRKKKNVYYIPIKNWLSAKAEISRKSLTEPMIAALATVVEDYTQRMVERKE